jgi:hypothetical protein
LAAGETGLAFVLATGLALRLSLAIAATLLWLFALLIARSLWLGEHFPCFCFGDSASKISIWTLNRTTLLALLASLLFLQTGGRASETGLLQGLAALALLGTVALAGRVPKLIALNAELAKRQRARNGGQPA